MIPLWAYGPFELLAHADGHMRKGGDFDRRMALISFDNSIEVSISTYLTLHPSQRQERKYCKRDVRKWQENYHTKLDFLKFAIEEQNSEWKVSRTEITWVHSYRNKQYHSSTMGVPETKVVEVARSAAIWVFTLLFRVNDVEDELDEYQEYGRIEQVVHQILSTCDRPPNGNDYATSAKGKTKARHHATLYIW